MPRTWMEALVDLQDYIAETKEIEINPEAVCLPDSVRPEFYRRFDSVRNEFVKAKMSSQIIKAEELSRHYKDIKSILRQRLQLEDIHLGTWLDWFLDDPGACLARILFDPLFALVKTKSDPTAFELHCEALLTELFNNLFRISYDRYCTLALMEALEPDGAFIVPVADRNTDPSLVDAELIPGNNVAVVPAIQPAQSLSIEPMPFTELLVPVIIVHSPKVGRYIGFRPDYHTVYRREESHKDSARWSRYADIWEQFGKENLWPDLGIYVANNIEDLKLLADYYYIIKPDLLVECEEREDWFEIGHVKSAIRHANVSEPALGTYILCLDPIPEAIRKRLKPEVMQLDSGSQSPQEKEETDVAVARTPDPLHLPEGIEFIQAGYDPRAFEPILKVLAGGLSKS